MGSLLWWTSCTTWQAGTAAAGCGTVDQEEEQEEEEVEEEEEEELSEIYQPLRQAVESRPSHARSLEVSEVEDIQDIQDIQDMEGLREHFQSRHGQTFHQSRQGGHSVTHAKYQGDDSQLTA